MVRSVRQWYDALRLLDARKMRAKFMHAHKDGRTIAYNIMEITDDVDKLANKCVV